MFSMFFAQTSPDSWLEPFMLPAIAAFFGGLMYFAGAMKERDGGKAPAKWIGVGICAIGMIIGFGPFWTYISGSADSEIYRTINHGRKMMIGHYGAFLVPLLIAGACAGHHFLMKWRNRVYEE